MRLFPDFEVISTVLFMFFFLKIQLKQIMSNETANGPEKFLEERGEPFHSCRKQM